MKSRDWGRSFWLFSLRYLLWPPFAWRSSLRMRFIADGFPRPHSVGDAGAAVTNALHYAIAAMTIVIDYVFTGLTIMVLVVAVGVPMNEGWLAVPLSIILVLASWPILLVRLQTVYLLGERAALDASQYPE